MTSNHHSVPSRAEFEEGVQDALSHLYDSPYLQKHTLADLLVGAADPLVRSQEVRRILLDAIRAMRPGPGVPAQSPDWRAYRILELRYIEGLPSRQVMDQVALAKSHYFREQARVLQMVADFLWGQVQRREEPGPAADGVAGPSSSLVHAEPPTTREELAQTEVERLCAHAEWGEVDVGRLLLELRDVVEPMAQAQAVSIHFEPVHDLVIARADWVLLRQAILNAITYGLDLAQGGRVAADRPLPMAPAAPLRIVIGPIRRRGAQGIRILAPRSSASPPAHQPATARRQGIGLLICQKLTTAMGGQFFVRALPGEQWEAQLTWPIDSAPILLVIDDNESFLDLFRRYLASYDWQVVGAVDGQQARRCLAEVVPTVIVLDVMMPREDGWALLRWLKAGDPTRDIPIIVCSVLNEPQLARSLGAAAYLPKPVTQRALLQALVPWHPDLASQGHTHPA